MVTPSPATPGPNGSATPGNGEQNGNPGAGSQSSVANNGGTGNQAPTITITVEEHRRLSRQDARARSFDRRNNLGRNRTTNSIPVHGNAADLDELGKAQLERDEANRRAMQLEVRGKVDTLLKEDRFKNIPQSTRVLILDAPHLLSDAETLEEAMFDIEDKLEELAAGETTPSNNQNNNNANDNNQNNNNGNNNSQTPARETPPAPANGAPAQVDKGVVEDVSGLRGPARSQAVLRNTFRAKQGGA